MGQRILRPDTMPSQVFLVLSGTVRLLAETPRGSRSLDRRGQGQLIGWVSLLRATPCEWVLASEETVLLGLPAKNLLIAWNPMLPFLRLWASFAASTR